MSFALTYKRFQRLLPPRDEQIYKQYHPAYQDSARMSVGFLLR